MKILAMALISDNLEYLREPNVIGESPLPAVFVAVAEVEEETALGAHAPVLVLALVLLVLALALVPEPVLEMVCTHMSRICLLHKSTHKA